MPVNVFVSFDHDDAAQVGGFFGASFLDWNEPGGFIHLSPYVWGVEAAQSPGFNIVWAGRKPLPLYHTYVSGLMELYQNSTPL